MATTTTTTPRANPLRAALAKAGGAATVKPAPAKTQEQLLAEIPDGPDLTASTPPRGQPSERLLRAMHEADEDAPNELSTIVESIEVEAVVGGCLQRMRLKANTDPAQVKAIILAADPNALVRDAFPMRGQSGSRETKTARAKGIIARITANGKFVDLLCQNGDDISVQVSKRKGETFVTDLAALGKLSEHNLKKIQDAFATLTAATVLLTEAEEFSVHYWTSDDGKAFMDSMSPEPPAAQPVAQA